MKRNWKLAVILGLAIALLPSPVLANAITPAISAMLLHLSIGNVFIGYIEGILLAKWFRIPRGPTTAILILANYASAWAGSFLLMNRLSGMANVTFENAYLWVCLFVVLAFLLTLLVEYPFFWFLLRKREKAVRESLKAAFVIHGISYALLFVWYGLHSPVSLVTQLDVVAAAQLQPPEEYVLYYMTTDGKQVMRSDLEGKRQEVVKEIDVPLRYNQLSACQNQEGQFDLFIKHLGDDKQLILSDFASVVPTYERLDSNNCTFDLLGRVPKLTDNTNWEYRTEIWRTGGITGENEKENLSFEFAFETPFISWGVSHATHLEGDFVVFQLRGDRICILQPQENKIAFITPGRKPIVVKP